MNGPDDGSAGTGGWRGGRTDAAYDASAPSGFHNHSIGALGAGAGDPCWDRTSDTLVKSQVLYQLS